MEDSAYGWIPFYEELANKIRPLRADRNALYEKLKATCAKAGMKLPRLEADGKSVELDPFTFFAQFNKGITPTNRIAMTTAIAELFDIQSAVPNSFAGIPFINNQRSTFYIFKSDPDRGEHDIDNLWDLFEAAIDYADSPDPSTRDVFVQAFDRALPQKGIKWNITMGLFWIRPKFYLPLDGRTRWFLCLPGSMKKSNIPALPASMPDDIVNEASKLFSKNEMMNAQTYLSFIDRCRSVLDQGGYGEYRYHTFPELSHQALVKSEDVNDQERAIKKQGKITAAENNDDHDDALTDFDNDEDDTGTTEAEQFAEPLDESRNLVFFGAPGTGKSHDMDKMVHDLFQGNYERVTFYADYQHAQFVGSYKPVMVDDQGTRKVEYRFRPGPFTRVLVKALNDPRHNHVLVIEELNRAEAASVFGDLFQLLDRSENGMSEYPVSVSEDLREFLDDPADGGNGGLTNAGKGYLAAQIEAGTGDDVSADTNCSRILIPRNMYIWATMNSADQGVYPLDTAFKRRWDFRYIGINEGEQDSGMPFWNERRRAINRLLLRDGVNEDKQIGPFFIGRVLDFPADREAFGKAMKNKVLMYLFEDAARYHRDIFSFDGDEGGNFSLQMLFDAWDRHNFGIFQGLDEVPEDQPGQPDADESSEAPEVADENTASTPEEDVEA